MRDFAHFDEPKFMPKPECECWLTDEKYWFTHYGAVEPGSQMEPNPDCREHFPKGRLWGMGGAPNA